MEAGGVTPGALGYELVVVPGAAAGVATCLGRKPKKDGAAAVAVGAVVDDDVEDGVDIVGGWWMLGGGRGGKLLAPVPVPGAGGYDITSLCYFYLA